MIVNEMAGSGGDAMPWMFRYTKTGPLIGKRTWGGLIGVSQYPTLMDGGNVTAPNFGFFSPDGQWDVENHGVAPDIEVEQDPKAVAEGHDPQLERAVTGGAGAVGKESAAAAEAARVPELSASSEACHLHRRRRSTVAVTNARPPVLPNRERATESRSRH